MGLINGRTEETNKPFVGIEKVCMNCEKVEIR